MKKEVRYNVFGQCYNQGDYSPFHSYLHPDVTYQSFDFLYTLKGRGKVIDALNTMALENKRKDHGFEAHSGFFFRQILFFKQLTPCAIICSCKDRTAFRIVYFRFRRGKIVSITGVDPKDYTHTRGPKL